MSLLGAFIAGVTGINAQSQKFGAISDNIANANTVGYKPTSVLFKTLVTQRPIPTNYAPGGVIPTPEARMDLQGLLSASSSGTDLGISGRGFFAVTNAVNTTSGAVASGANYAVTRAGSFQLDKNGFLVNSNGYYMLGVTAGSGMPTSLTGLSPVKLDAGPSVTIAGVATTSVKIAANLPASQAIGGTQTMSVGVFDGLGNPYALNITLTKTALNTWQAVATSATQASGTGTAITATVSGSPLTLSFDGTGNLTSSGTGSLGSVSFSNGQSISPTFDFKGTGAISSTTQFGDSFAQSGVIQDGKTSGTRTGIQVSSDGTVSEVYSNGLVLPKYQVPVVTYINPQGLEAASGNIWLGTDTSGTEGVNVAGTGGAGEIVPSTLEQSSVDLSTEFSEMIISQNTYQANTKTITVADEMWRTVTQLR